MMLSLMKLKKRLMIMLKKVLMIMSKTHVMTLLMFNEEVNESFADEIAFNDNEC